MLLHTNVVVLQRLNVVLHAIDVLLHAGPGNIHGSFRNGHSRVVFTAQLFNRRAVAVRFNRAHPHAIPCLASDRKGFIDHRQLAGHHTPIKTCTRRARTTDPQKKHKNGDQNKWTKKCWRMLVAKAKKGL